MHLRCIILLSILISVFNILDGVATHFGLLYNKIDELNPLMRFLWVLSPSLFLAVKIALSLSISYLSYLIYRLSGRRFQQLYTISLATIFVLYSLILSLHLYWLTAL
ncbi:DUF5658 family protein [Lysinibacillus sp. NPDC097195]|uniref:DUF5658 family protein n=1 Tax=Lysinibacillus sp. NPDC097195 TaxID=3364141 RepID=UPI0037F2C498